LSKQTLSRFDSICFSEGEEEKTSHDPSPPFKERVEVLGLVSNGRRRRRFLAWWPMEGEGEGSWLGGQWKEKEKVLFYLFPFSPQALTSTSIFYPRH
jgi:hypothetical protein